MATIDRGDVLEKCPEGDATGPDVYRAHGHSKGTACHWMMMDARRCGEHDELLRPDEDTCPYPDAPEEDENQDQHNRLGLR